MGGNITFTDADGITYDLETIQKDKMFDKAPTEMYTTEKTQHDNHIKHIKPRKRYKGETRKVARTKIYKPHEILREIKFMTGQRDDKPTMWNMINLVVLHKDKPINNNMIAKLLGRKREDCSGRFSTVRRWLEAREWCGVEIIDRKMYVTYQHHETDVDYLYEDYKSFMNELQKIKRDKKRQEKTPADAESNSSAKESNALQFPSAPQPALTLSIKDDTPEPEVNKFSKVYLNGKAYGLIDLDVKNVICEVIGNVGLIEAFRAINNRHPNLNDSDKAYFLSKLMDFVKS